MKADRKGASLPKQEDEALAVEAPKVEAPKAAPALRWNGPGALIHDGVTYAEGSILPKMAPEQLAALPLGSTDEV